MGGSSDEQGLFEFDQLSDSDDADNDPPDEPDPPDGDGADENAPQRVDEGDGSSGSDDDTSNEPTAVEADDSPETGDSTNDGSSGESESSDDGSSSDGDSSDNDAPDPPDPSDGSNGGNSRFYDFDPVDESQKAFQFAEKQSRAAAESAYKRAAASLLGQYIQKYTSPEVRKRLDEVFSRRMLGSVFVGGAFSKILETSIEVYFGASSLWRPVTWLIIFSMSTIIFVWWDHLARRASETAEKASEAASEAAEKASEAAEKATETAEKASEAASGATGKSSEAETAEVVGAGVAQAVQNREGGSSAAARAGGRRPTAVRSRSRAPDRRPNKRFEGESVPYDEVVGDADDEPDTPVFEGGRFKDPADAEDSYGR